MWPTTANGARFRASLHHAEPAAETKGERIERKRAHRDAKSIYRLWKFGDIRWAHQSMAIWAGCILAALLLVAVIGSLG